MSMSCENVRQAIVWFLDDELDAEGALELEAHLQRCRECRAFLQQQSALRDALRRAATDAQCPTHLRRAVRSQMAAEGPNRLLWLRMAPAVAAAAILGTFLWQGNRDGLPTELREVARRHARNLPMDVVAADSSQLQRVVNYFNGKLPFAVRPPRVQRRAVRQLGGRITHLGNRDAAYLRYHLPRGRMSVFVYEDRGNELSEVAPLYRLGRRRMLIKRVRGYTVAKWRDNGLVYSVVTDLAEPEISTLLRAGWR